MTDKQILDRLHNINFSHAQKMDLINVIKDISKENTKNNININYTGDTFIITIKYYPTNKSLNIFGQDVMDGGTITKKNILTYFKIDNNESEITAYALLLIMHLFPIYANEVTNDENNNVLVSTIGNTKYICNIRDVTKFDITYLSLTENGTITYHFTETESGDAYTMTYEKS
jgi:hypothetical protein